MPDGLISLYKQFWTRFHAIVRDQPGSVPDTINFKDAAIDPMDGVEYNPRTKMREIQLTEPIYLADWAVPRSMVKRDVILSVRERYLTNEPTVSIYTANDVAYLRVDPDGGQPKRKASLRNRLRFDYDPRQSIVASPDHPLFHMHLVGDDIEHFPSRFASTREFEKRAAPQMDPDNIRIPTARMCFPSVLCLLVADHFGGEVLNTLLDQTKDIRDSLRAPNECEAWGDHVYGAQGNKKFTGWHWYYKKIDPKIDNKKASKR